MHFSFYNLVLLCYLVSDLICRGIGYFDVMDMNRGDRYDMVMYLLGFHGRSILGIYLSTY